MNQVITIPQSMLKRLEKVAGRRSPQSIIKTAIADRIAYEEFFLSQVEAGVADEKAGRVYDKEAFELQLKKARNERKKTA